MNALEKLGYEKQEPKGRELARYINFEESPYKRIIIYTDKSVLKSCVNEFGNWSPYKIYQHELKAILELMEGEK